MRRVRALVGLLSATALAGAADAASTTFAGLLDLRAGYGSNPYLTGNGSNGGTGQAGGTLTLGLTRRTSTSTTLLSGVADVVQSFSKYGRSENFTATLNRSQQLSEHFSIDAGIGYANTINPGASYQSTLVSGAYLPGGVLGPAVVPETAAGVATTAPIGTVPITTVPIGTFDPSNLDLYTIGQRSQRYSGNLGANWLVTSRDQLTLAGSASRVHYNNFNGNYTQYGGTGSYLHTLTPRTQVGFNVGANYVSTENYPSAHSYTANLLLNQRLSSHWRANLGAGIILPRGGYGATQVLPYGSNGTNQALPAGGYAQSRKVSFGFNAAVCGTYTHANICLTAARQAAPTGIGGLRTDLQAGFTLGYQLSERDQVNAGATVDHSQGNVIVPSQDFYQASAGYSHVLTRRISIGGSGRYQRRSGTGIFPSGTSYSVTLDVITRFGRGQ